MKSKRNERKKNESEKKYSHSLPKKKYRSLKKEGTFFSFLYSSGFLLTQTCVVVVYLK